MSNLFQSRHYVELARIVSLYPDELTREMIALYLAEALEGSGARYDKDHFLHLALSDRPVQHTQIKQHVHSDGRVSWIVYAGATRDAMRYESSHPTIEEAQLARNAITPTDIDPVWERLAATMQRTKEKT